MSRFLHRLELTIAAIALVLVGFIVALSTTIVHVGGVVTLAVVAGAYVVHRRRRRRG